MQYNPKSFVDSLYSELQGAYASVPGGKPTLYGTCYGLLTQYYLNNKFSPDLKSISFILDCQHPETGMFEGPEFSKEYFEGKKHDSEHILLHLLCAVLPVLQQFSIKPRYAIAEAHKFCDLTYLEEWLNQRDWIKAWLEGNNILFVGQILVYLRDEEKMPEAQKALDYWFQWLDKEIDPNTGLWGTNGYCSPFRAMCGGYHQLLVYYYENHPVQSPARLVDTVLALQHPDGGFSPSGGGGACEDVDAVDILVNLYKLQDYKRPQIRVALKRCLRHILALQNKDGGFPYKRDIKQSHMGIPDTVAGPNVSTMFATWFRVHTLALISEILTDAAFLSGHEFNFSKALSMGWHRKWDKAGNSQGSLELMAEIPFHLEFMLRGNIKKIAQQKNKLKTRVKKLIA